MSVRKLSAADERALTLVQTSAAILGRDDLVAVVVTGRDRAKFLHNMLTQEVKALPLGAVRMTCLCDAQGKMLAIAQIVAEAERFVLWTDRAQAATLHEFLDKYVIADDVELALDEDLALLTLTGPLCEELAQQIGILATADAVATEVGGAMALVWCQEAFARQERFFERAISEIVIQIQRDQTAKVVAHLQSSGAKIGCHAATDAVRILAGRPLLGIDVDDASLPQEVGLKHSISYRKGCYLGQEAIAMMTYRGQMRRHLCWVERVGEISPQTGWTLRTLAGRRGGRVGSAFERQDGSWLGLAMVQRAAFAKDAELIAESGEGAQARVRIVAATAAEAFIAAESPGAPP